MTTGDWRNQRSGERPSVRGIEAAPSIHKVGSSLPPPLPRDINRADAECVRECWAEAMAWWLAEHNAPLNRLAEKMNCSHSYLIDVRTGCRPLQTWMLRRSPLDLFMRFSGLVAGEIATSKRRACG